MSESDSEPDNPEPRDPWAPPAEPGPADARPHDQAPLPLPVPAPVPAPAPAPVPVGLTKPSVPDAPAGFAAPDQWPVPGSATPPPPPPGEGPYGQPMPYPPPPYGYPGYAGYPMPPYGAWPPQTARNGFGITAMVLGIVGTVLGIACFGAVLGLPLGIAAIIFGIIGLRLANRGEASNRSQALTGLILGIVSVVISAVMIAILVTGVIGGALGGWDEGGNDTSIGADSGDYGDPLGENDTAGYDDGVQVTVSSVESTSALKDVADGGVAITFTVTVVNHSDSEVDLDDSEISAYASDDDEDPLQDMSSGDSLTGNLYPEGTRSTTMIVLVPEGDDGTIQLEISPGYEYDYVYWEVAA
jgi:hypothetical protein